MVFLFYISLLLTNLKVGDIADVSGGADGKQLLSRLSHYLSSKSLVLLLLLFSVTGMGNLPSNTF